MRGQAIRKDGRDLTVGLLAVAVVVGAHLGVEAAGPDYRGVLLPVDRIFDIGCAVALIVLAWAIGLAILRGVDFDPDSATERLLFAMPIGVGGSGNVGGCAGRWLAP